jgi:hypothetical protein
LLQPGVLFVARAAEVKAAALAQGQSLYFCSAAVAKERGLRVYHHPNRLAISFAGNPDISFVPEIPIEAGEPSKSRTVIRAAQSRAGCIFKGNKGEEHKG